MSPRVSRTSVLAAVLGLTLTACAGETAETTAAVAAGDCSPETLPLVSPGVLTVATGEPAFPPWVIGDDPTTKQGFEAAVTYAVASQLGFADDEVVWVRTGFDEVIAPGPKDFDLNIQQYSITAERDEVVDFSAPYYVTNQALVAYADSPIADAASVAELRDARLGAQIGTTSLSYIEDVIDPTTPAAVYDTNADAKLALDADQIDGLVFDLPTAYYITAAEIPEAAIVGVFEVSEDQADRLGFLMADGSPLTSCVDAAIETLRADGTLDTLADEWLAQSGELRTITP